jgi:hypothetical protein
MLVIGHGWHATARTNRLAISSQLDTNFGYICKIIALNWVHNSYGWDLNS